MFSEVAQTWEKAELFLNPFQMGWKEGKEANLAKLPTILLRPQSRPPAESLKDVRASKLLEKVIPGCTVHGDGARAWKSESKRLRLRFKNVVHCKMQFSKLVRVRRLPKLTGTQCLDQTWKQLKRYIPKELRSRDQTTRRDNHRLEEYVWSFLFRMNVRPKLLEALGKLAQKANTATR